MAIAETLGVTEGEVVMAFPKGKEARGYYNSMGNQVIDIALVSKPFMGQESYFIGFFARGRECVFKVYLGRDKQRQLFS